MSFERRQVSPVSVTVETEIDNCSVYNYKSGSSLVVERVSGTCTTLTVYGVLSVDGTGTYKILKDRDGTIITITVDATYLQAVNLDVFACPFLKFVGNANGVIRVAGKS